MSLESRGLRGRNETCSPLLRGETSGLASRVPCVRVPLALHMQPAAESRNHIFLKSSQLYVPTHASTFICSFTGEQGGFLGNARTRTHARTHTAHNIICVWT